MNDEDFIRVWRHWDVKPSGKAEANAMEDACIEKAAELGMPTTDFRVLLAAWFRLGHTRAQSLLAVRAGMLAGSS